MSFAASARRAALAAQRSTGSRFRKGKGDVKFGIAIVPGPRAMNKVFKQAGEKMMDLRPVWNPLLPRLQAGIARNIESKGAALGETWGKPIEPYNTNKKVKGLKKGKRRVGRGKGDLELSGKLKKSLKGKRSKLSLTKKLLRVGTRVKYGPAVNFGYLPPGPQPRKFMGWNSGMRKAADKLMRPFIENIVKRAAKAMDNAMKRGTHG